jgi:hypothetical protein
MQDQSSSSKTIQSDSLRVATNRVGSTENTESAISNVSYSLTPVQIPTNDSSESSVSMRPENTAMVFPRTMTVTLTGLLRFFHIENFENASEVEANFLRLLHFNLHANIKRLAREAQGSCDMVANAVLLELAGTREDV